MRRILLLVTLLLTACSNLPRPLCHGTRAYDPQFCYGESFQQIPNFENEALIRRSRGEVW